MSRPKRRKGGTAANRAANRIPHVTGALAGPPIGLTARYAWPLAIVAASILFYGSAVSTYFAQDDFNWLLSASRPFAGFQSPLRILSLDLYFRALLALAGANAGIFHAVGLAVHTASGILLYLILVRRFRPVLAAAASILFVTAPLALDAVHWVSAVADLLCALFLLLSAWLLTRPGELAPGSYWTAVAFYILALESKELAIGAAPALALMTASGRGAAGQRRALVFVSLGAGALLLAASALHPGKGAAYELGAGAALRNLPAYCALTVAALADFLNFLTLPGPAGLSRLGSEIAWSELLSSRVIGWAVLVGWLGWIALRRSRSAALGLIWFLGLMAPVLFLKRHFYFYYLYVALPGFLASVAILAHPRDSRRPVSRFVLIPAGVLLLAQAAALYCRSTALMSAAPLPADFVLRRALIARNACADLAAQMDSVGPEVVLVGGQLLADPVASGRPAGAPAQTPELYWDLDVRSALGEGKAIQLLQPGIRSVAFRRLPLAEDRGRTILSYRLDGHLRAMSYDSYQRYFLGSNRSVYERLGHAVALLRAREFDRALGELNDVLRSATNNPDVLRTCGLAYAAVGDTDLAIRLLGRGLGVAPADQEARFSLGNLYSRRGLRARALEIWSPLLKSPVETEFTRRAREAIAALPAAAHP